jgi:monofunctional biosynthetic peptidoglycan transglycosylase
MVLLLENLGRQRYSSPAEFAPALPPYAARFYLPPRRGAPAISGHDTIGVFAKPRSSRLVRRVVLACAVLALLPVPVIVLYRFAPPPVTPLMLIRAAEGNPIIHHWVPYQRIAPALPRAVIASEDERFCWHWGFDWVEIDKAIAAHRAGEPLRGASTISQQLARNLFLWPGGGYFRKGIEAYITVLLEVLLSKQRILELYLNVVEWGHGIYGAEAAARAHFGRDARRLTTREAALLAAVLPAPLEWRPEHPTRFLEERTDTILARMPEVAVPRGRVCR